MPLPNPSTGMRNTTEGKRPIDEWAAFLACRPFSTLAPLTGEGRMSDDT